MLSLQKLSKRYQSNPEKFSTLQSMVVHELETNTHEARNSATDALLWLKRWAHCITHTHNTPSPT